MDLKRIEHFLVVVECRSFSKAAAVIGIAQPALGRHIQKLEEDCGLKLLYRNGRGVSVTPVGEHFVQRVRPLVKQLEAVTRELQDEQATASGFVTVGMTQMAANLLGMKLFEVIRDKYPQIRLNIVSGHSGYIHEWLVDGRVDVAILNDARRSRHIAVDCLAEVRLHLMSAANTSIEKKVTTIELKKLAQLPLVLPTKAHGLRRALECACTKVKAKLNVQFELDTLPLMKELVAGGLAHTVLAVAAVRREIEAGELVSRRIQKPEVVVRLMVASALHRPVTQAIRMVQNEIREQMRVAVAESKLDLDMRVF